MNLAQMKVALEQSVQEVLQKSLSEGINVVTSYDVNGGFIIAELKEEKEIDESRSSILCYSIRYTEETKETAIVAFNRVFVKDALGVAIVNNEPVSITNTFINDIAQIIAIGIDKAYHPENYQPAEEAAEEVIDGNAE